MNDDITAEFVQVHLLEEHMNKPSQTSEGNFIEVFLA